MIEIHKTEDGKQFFVRNEADGNNEILHSSEPVQTKASAIKNIKATRDLYRGAFPLDVRDCTGKKPKIITIDN